ncbi:hypothetical protein ASZ90_019493 [hydrocarbon metagenome]|uniref:Uncharacterized protein n=1 Tax=hydrocarbon metagenome TaxID=938273 RepID=A0A0W8E420_9ZZZZ
MKRLLLKFKPLRNEINSISTEAVFRIYVQSDFAQIAFEFESDVIKELAEFNIKLEFSILSWGGVED